MTHAVSQSGHRRPRLLVLLLVAGLLTAGLASGLGSALAADPSASPAGDRVVLHVGWTNDPDNLEAVNTAKWDGWTRMYGGAGAAFYTSYVRDGYRNLKPKAAAAGGSGGSTSTATIGVIGAFVALAVLVVIWLALRRRWGAAEEE